MSEIQTIGGHAKGAGVKKSKKLSTKVDLTPMVDLGFLLITFFIFTTTMNQPTAMKLVLPADSNDSIPVKASEALTLLLGKNNVVYYYEGELINDASKIYTTTYIGIRDLISNKRKKVKSGDFVVIIKPQTASIYKNTVDALDEMTISNISHFSLANTSPVEEQLVQIADKRISQ